MAIDGLVRKAGVGRAFRGLDGRHFATVLVDRRIECYVVESEDFRRLLARRYHEATGLELSPMVLAEVVQTLRDRAEKKDERTFVVLRRSRRDGWSAYLVDLGERGRRAAEHYSRQWRVVDRPGVTFWRSPWRHLCRPRERRRSLPDGRR
jgi:hypothetical protein